MNHSLKQGSKTRHFDSLEQEAYLSLWRTFDRLRAIEDELFNQWDLTAQQYNVLRLLKSAHPQPVGTLQLQARLVSRAPDITRMLDKLERLKLISRCKLKEDRRAVMVGITPSGMALLEEISEPLRESHEKQLGHLSVSDLKTMVSLLRIARQPHEPEHSDWK